MPAESRQIQPIDRSAHEILVVDDNPTSLYTTQRWLRSAGFRTCEAATGTEGLALANGGVSAVVLDVHLPDIDGNEVCRRLRMRSEGARVPVLLISASFVSDEDKVRGLDAGADAYLTHPVDASVLVATVQALIRVRDAEEALLRVEREKVELREQFVAVLGHDLRNPLSAIRAVGELLVRRGNEQELGRRIRASATRIARLIDDVLDFTRGRLGSTMGVRIAPASDLAVALADVVDEGRHAHPEREIRDAIDVREDVWCDQARIQQLLSNLLGNAIHHGASDRPITVTASISRQALVLEVANYGNPIGTEDMKRIFEPFWRASDSAHGGGLGLGLHICAQIVEAHNGRLEVTSSADDGTRFTALIPIGAPGN